MSWKGTYRSISSTARKIDREMARSAREAERARKAAEKQAEIEHAEKGVALFEAVIAQLTLMHTQVGQSWDWTKINSKPQPLEPMKSNAMETSAREQLANYQPSRADKMLRRTEKKRTQLQQATKQATEKDEQNYQNALRQYQEDLAIWQLSARIVKRDPEAYVAAIEKYGPWESIEGLGSYIHVSTDDGATIEADLTTFGDENVPKDTYSQLKSGKLSVKPMPKSRYWAIYQDYICGSAIRLARECFALVPTNIVIASVLDNIVNTSTGHLEKLPILSVAIPRETLDKLNLMAIDPSDAMTNFVHNMKFKKTKGFDTVKKLKSSDFS